MSSRAVGTGCVAAIAMMSASAPAWAQQVGSAPSPLVTASGLALLGLLPFLLVVTTSFTKFAVVLSILRSALGTQNVPPNVVLAALAVLLSAYVMAPVYTEMADAAQPLAELSPEEARDVMAWPERLAPAAEPLRAFLLANAGAAELSTFAALRDVPVDDPPMSVIVPAFTITELSEAFQIGFLLFLPFLVLDLLIGSVLLSLGMHMLSPTTVSMPFKLLLFVLVNGWLALSESLVLGYQYPGGG